VITEADGLKRYETQDEYLARVAGHEIELSFLTLTSKPFIL